MSLAAIIIRYWEECLAQNQPTVTIGMSLLLFPGYNDSSNGT